MTPAQRIENYNTLIATIRATGNAEAEYRFHMDGYIADEEDVRDGEEAWIEKDFCGTCCCIAGTIRVIQLGLKDAKSEFKASDNIIEYQMKAGAYLDLDDYHTIDALFVPWSNSDTNLSCYAGRSLTPDMAISVLEKLRDNPDATEGDVIEYWNDAWATRDQDDD